MNQAYVEHGIQPLQAEWGGAVRSKSASAFEQITARLEPVFTPGGMAEYETQMADFLRSNEDSRPAKTVSVTLPPDTKAASKSASTVSAERTKARRVGGQNLLGITYIALDFDDPMNEEELKEWGY